MPKKSPVSRLTPLVRMRHVIRALARTYPDVGCSLDVDDPLETLVATILSAQCTDKKVNQVTPALFRAFPDAAAFARARRATLERIIRPIGLYRAKARNIIAAARMIVDDFQGRVPDTIDELVKLPGVGRKTANCVLVNAYNRPGIMCDTHCCRVTRRLGLHEETDPVKIEFALAALMPPKEWGAFSHRIIVHGREVCHARTPACGRCPLRRWCAYGQSGTA